MWMEMLEKRNLMAHTYDEEIFEKAVSQVVNLFYPEVKKLYEFFKAQK